MVATAVAAAAAAIEQRGGEARAHVHRTALGTVTGRYRGAGRGVRRPVHFTAVVEGGRVSTDFLAVVCTHVDRGDRGPPS